MRESRHALTLGTILAATLSMALPARAADNFDIDVVMPLTGGGSFLGQGEQQALQLAEKVANANGGIGGKQVHFVFHDDQTSPQTAVQLTNEVLAKHPSVLLGSSIVAMCTPQRFPCAEIARSNDAIVCVPSRRPTFRKNERRCARAFSTRPASPSVCNARRESALARAVCTDRKSIV